MIERAAGGFAGREKAMNYIAAGVQDFAFVGNADAAEGKRDATGHRKSIIRRRV
jgi:hypothetical protein